MIRYLKICLALLISNVALAQTDSVGTVEKWNLQKCVDYALQNNISVKQTDIQAQYSALALKESKSGLLPTLNFNTNASERWGLSENPTTGILENNNFFNVSSQMQAQVTLFNWFSRRNAIKADALSLQADNEQTKKVQNDVALNVAIAYLQILLAREQVNINKIQIQQTTAQFVNTQKQVDAGKLPELNAAQIESQLATDSSNLITAEATASQYVLQLKALLNLDAGMPFDVETPPVDRIPVETLAELQPESVYASALTNLPQQKVNQLRIDAALKEVKVARAQLYPTISAFGSLGSSYVNLKNPKFGPGPIVATGATVTVNNTPIDVLAPTTIITGYTTRKFGRQYQDNFAQGVGVGLSVPIFNGRVGRTAFERSRVNVRNLELTKELGDQTLKQDIYKAYIDATSAIQKFNANRKGVEISQKAYDYAQKRYDVGLLSTYDLLITQNSLLTAKTNLLYAQYDYVFKMKLLEFYKGQGLKL